MPVTIMTAVQLVFVLAGIHLRTAKMFPDGFDHDFGKVQTGAQARHAFRIVNMSKVSLQIVSVRRS
jgi:hypothetical protein